ncbi:heterokaryon incompatibility protein-domain-containing protein [Podospora aff. communis PSN243]|uniref:Heterokaryon incompatibility protein-domain-containing protein n=1 Tax=Podospora aff. communis PSN243 TaxID=3040156 RepID=A0AAV9GCN6_9PEZI|nr:heterokaryon incompatibility protein-domain-containing protein [Podospora aff. communis PSN243]
MASGDRLSAACVDMLRSEIGRCVTLCNHPVLSPGYIPSRLLFIGTEDVGDNQLRLETREQVHEKANLSGTESTRYAALSYCWGSPDDAERQCKTKTHSLGAWHGCIPDRYLSPVVRDAVRLTRSLKICYLWVDALCIIQDDMDDWQRESPLMGSVYSNAYFTIMVLNSATCQQGFLTAGGPGEHVPPSNDGELPSSADGKLLADWKAAAWTSRGWTFQEEKLSTRAIYVGPERMYFACTNWIAAEDSPEERALVKEKSVPHMVKKASTSERGIRSLMNYWELNMLPQYSNRSFTRPQDKLQAIASVAKCIGDHIGYDYAAGLWVQRMHIQLLWHCRPAHARLADLIGDLRPGGPGFIAPSWSWARFGTVRELSFRFSAWKGGRKEQRGLKREAQLDVPVIENIGADRYVQVQKGSLRMQTKVMRLNELIVGSGALPEDAEKFRYDWSESGNEQESLFRAKLELVVIGSNTGNGTAEKQLYGIVAYPADDATGTYFRVGIFECPVQHQSRFEGVKSMESRTITII